MQHICFCHLNIMQISQFYSEISNGIFFGCVWMKFFCIFLVVHDTPIQYIYLQHYYVNSYGDSIHVEIFTGRNEVVAKVIFLHLSVILFTGESASVHAGIPHPPGSRPPQSRHPRTRHLPGADTNPDQAPPGSRHPPKPPPDQAPPWEQTPRTKPPWTRHPPGPG